MTSSIGEAVEGKIEEVEDSIRSLDKLGPDEGLSEFGSSLGEAMEERIEAVGESILALDERVERARASVETALNELVRVLRGMWVSTQERWRSSLFVFVGKLQGGGHSFGKWKNGIASLSCNLSFGIRDAACLTNDVG